MIRRTAGVDWIGQATLDLEAGPQTLVGRTRIEEQKLPQVRFLARKGQEGLDALAHLRAGGQISDSRLLPEHGFNEPLPGVDSYRLEDRLLG